MFSLKGRVGLLTGASRGIGRAIATELTACGARLALHARTLRPEFQRFAQSLETKPGSTRAFGGDLSDPAAVRDLMRAVRSWSPRLDFVVANAGVYAGSASREVGESEWDAMLGTNLRGEFRTVLNALPLLEVSRHASVVLISSILATRASPGSVPYQSSKAAIEQMGRALALELAPNVRVNTVAPGFIRTDMNREGHEDPTFRRHVERATPLGRWGEPSDIAPAVRFLLSDEASWITGAVLLVDGGLGLA
ncbi:MAG: SDR family oxidoreductase [Thermoplasmata archaeon]|nr:SDR family oxidoreductase [Thermoplasmata archaeon]